MPQSSKPRKAYRPRGVNPQAHLTGMMGAAWLHIDDRTVWSLQLDEAITAVAKGTASQAKWSRIFAAIALLEELARAGKVKDPDGIAAQAEQTCIAILDRYGKRTRAVRAQELSDLRVMYQAWSAAISSITQSEKFQAEERIARRLELGQATVLPLIA